MSDQTKMLKRYQEGKNKLQTNIQQAIIIYKQALQCFRADEDTWENYYIIKIQLGSHQRDINSLQDAYMTINEAIDGLQKFDISSKIEEKITIRKLKYLSYHNVAKLLVQMAAQASLKEDYTQYRKWMNQSFDYFQKATSIGTHHRNSVVHALIDHQQHLGRMSQYYQNELIKLKSNCLQLLFQQAVQFNDLALFQIILNEVQKSEILYRANKCLESETHLYRCYYYKAISLRQLGRINESLELLKKVFDYEKRHNNFVDAKKSRDQILRSLLNRNQIKQALRYLQSKEEKDTLNSIKNKRQQIKKMFSKSSSQIRQYSQQQYEAIFKDFDNNQQQYSYDYQQVDNYLSKSVDQYKNNSQLQGLLLYYISQANYRLKRYNKAQMMIEEALKLNLTEQFQKRDYEIVKFKIKCKVEEDLQKIHKIYQSFIKELDQIQNGLNQQGQKLIKCQRQEINKIYKEFQKNSKKKRQIKKYIFTSEEQNKLINSFAINGNFSRGSQLNNMDIEECASISSGNRINKISKQYKMNPQESYVSLCKQQNQPVREQIKKTIFQPTFFNPFTQLINSSLNQLQIIIKTVKVANMDLRYHVINDVILQALLNQGNLNYINQFKINGSNHISHQIVMKVLLNMPQLTYLSFLNFHCLKYSRIQVDNNTQPRNIVHILRYMNMVNSLINLKVLKLKYCNIFDQHLPELQLKNLYNLQELSLSHNNLHGDTLSEVFMMKKLTQINLSDNPLSSISLQSWKYRLLQSDFTLNSFKIRNIKLQFILRTQLICLINKVIMLDLSECQELGKLFEEMMDSFYEGRLNFANLKKMIMKRVTLDSNSIRNLVNILQNSFDLKEVDMRESGFQNREQLYYFQKQYPDCTILMSQIQTSPNNLSKLKNGNQFQLSAEMQE